VSFSEKIVDGIQRRRWLVLLAVLLSCVFATRGALKVGVDNSLEIWFVEEDPSLETYHEFQDEYGSDEVVILALKAEGGVFTAANMAQLSLLTQKAEAVDGIAKAFSITNARGLDGTESGLDISPLYSPEKDFDAERLKRRVQENPLFHGRMVSKDGKTALVMATMAPSENLDAVRDGILEDLREAVEGTGLPVQTAGMGVIYSALNRLSLEDSQVFIAASNLVIFAILGFLFRRWLPVVITLLVIGVASLWLMGLYGAAGKSTNMVTMVLPTLMLIIGVSDCVHFLGHASKPVEGLSREERVRKGLGFMFWPCLMNSLTTAAGFASLAAAPMPVIRDLGLFAALGVLGAFVASLIGCSIGMMWEKAEPAPRGSAPVKRFVGKLAALASKHPARVLVGALFALLLSGLGMTQLKVDTYSIGFLRSSHPVYQDSVAIESNFGPYTPLEFLVRMEGDLESDEAPAVLRAVADWQDAMEAEPDVGWSRSSVDTVRRLSQVWGDGSPEAYALPTDDNQLYQLMLQYDPHANPGLPKMLSEDQTELRVTVGIPMGTARDFEESIHRLSALAKLPQGSSLEATGYLPLYVKMMESVVQSQLSSFGLAFCVIFLMLALLFRSLRLAALAVPANLLPVLMILGIMGIAGIALDVATVTISAVVLGLVVDDTTQFLYRFKHELKARGDMAEAVEHAVNGAGKAMATTTVVLSLGFLVLTLTAVKSIAFFGLLCAIALVVALLGDLLILPAMMMLFRPRV